MKLLLNFLLLLVLTGCVSTFNGSFHFPTYTVKEDFKIVSTIEGQAQAEYIFGIGGYMKDGLLNEAKRRMYSSVVLNPNQNITNITVDNKTTSFLIPLIWQSRTVIVSADVIEFYSVHSKLPTSRDNNIEASGAINNKETKSAVDGSNDWTVIDNSNSSDWTSKDEDIKNYNLISSFKVKAPATLKIARVVDVKIGDIVTFKTENKDNLIYWEYGVIREIEGDVLKVNTYPEKGKKQEFSDYFKIFRKVLN